MSKTSEAIPLAGVPALCVQYGDLPQKWWPLELDALVIGRARGCDLVLDSHEVSQVHCVLTFRPTGWIVRDCGSRNGTRINGEVISTTPLRDEDVLKIGPFSFIARLPHGGTAESMDQVLLRRKAELQRHADLLRERLRDCEQRATRLDNAERELAQDRKTLEMGLAELQRRRRQAECGQTV